MSPTLSQRASLGTHMKVAPLVIRVSTPNKTKQRLGYDEERRLKLVLADEKCRASEETQEKM